MPILLAIPLVIGLLAYGAYRLFMLAAAQAGWIAGVGADVLAVALIVALVAWGIYRYRLVHGRAEGGRRMVQLRGDWGTLSLDAQNKQGTIACSGQTASFIFADIAQAQLETAAGGPAITLDLRHCNPPQWRIPLRNQAEARRWEKILRYAQEQKL